MRRDSSVQDGSRNKSVMKSRVLNFMGITVISVEKSERRIHTKQIHKCGFSVYFEYSTYLPVHALIK